MLELGLFIIFIVIGLIYFANVIRPKPIPGIQIADDYSWLLGHIKAFYANINNLHDYRLSHALKAERTGQTCFQELLPSMPARVDILTTELMQFVLKDKFDIFEKGDRFKQLSGEIFGNFLVTSDGLEWKKQRKLIMPMFSFREINAKMFSVFVSNAQKFIDLLKTMPSDKYIDMQNLFHHYTMDCTCEIAFGINIDTLTSSNAKEFEEAFDDAVEIVYNRLLVPDIIWKLKRKFNLGSEKKLKKCVSTLHNFAHNIIIERREQLRTKSSVTSSDILTSIMLSNDPELTSDKFLLDLILNLILGGRETTAVALTHLFHLLQLYPDVEERLINEFRSKKNEITQETINNMIYADAVFHETCRYMPPVPYDFKVCNEDIMLPGNIFIPKNTIITYTPYHYHRLKSIWGKDAEEFKPERWIDDEGRFKTESQYKFISFNAGPRLCLGKSMAQLEAKILFLMLLNEFQFKLKPNFNCLIKSTVTCPFQDGLPMLVSKRQY